MAKGRSGIWTIESYVIHAKAMREVETKLQDAKVQHLEAVVALNDRRYTEGNELRAMALKIKETADRDALELDRASQAYKAERNDVIREQSLKETGVYATRDDLAEVVKGIGRELKPLIDYVASQKGIVQGADNNTKKIYAAIGAVCVIIPILVILINIFIK